MPRKPSLTHATTWNNTMRRVYGSKQGVSKHMGEIGSMGGSVPREKRGFQLYPELPSAAGRLGGMRKKRNVSPQYQKKLDAAYKQLQKVQDNARKERAGQ